MLSISLYSVNDQSNTTNNESTSSTDTCTSGDSCIFYTPDASLNSDFKFIPLPTIISDIFTNFQPLSTHNDPLFSRDATEFICNLNPPNSSFVIGASTTQSCKVSLLPIPHKDFLRSNKARVPVSPVKYKRINFGKISATIADNFDLDSSGKNMAYSSRKFCQTTHLSQKKILPQESESADESFHTPMGLDSPSRRYLRTPTDTVLRCNLCSNTYSSKNRYENHLSRHYTGHNIWSCASCNFTFHSHKSFRYHTVTTHNCKPLRRSDRNISMLLSTNTGLPNQVKHYLQKTNRLTPKLVEENNLSFKVEDSFSRIRINTTSTPLLPTKKPKRRYIRKDKKYAKDKISTENAFYDGRHNNRVKQNLEQILKPFKCDQCTKRCSTLRALNIHKFMHKRLAMDSSSNDVTRSLASTRSLRQISARTSPCKLCEFDCSLHVLQC